MVDALPVFVKGMFAGALVSVPPGAVAGICIGEAARRGFRRAAVLAIAASVADAILATLVLCSLLLGIGVSAFVRSVLKVLAPLLLSALGVHYLVRGRRAGCSIGVSGPQSDRGRWGCVAVTFFASLFAPGTIPALFVLLQTFGVLSEEGSGIGPSILLVAGVLSGGMLWWIAVCAVGSRWRAAGPKLRVLDTVTGALLLFAAASVVVHAVAR